MARSKSHPVALSQSERQMLVRFVRTGSHRAQEVRRARILLELDENDPGRRGALPAQEQVAERAGVHVSTVQGISKAYAERGGEVEARLIALACSAPPEGHARWSLRLLEKRVSVSSPLCK